MRGTQVIGLLCLVLLLSSTAALPDLKAFFDTLRGSKVEENKLPTVSSENDKVHSRQKRQGSGDSSHLPYEASTQNPPLHPNGTIDSRYMPVTANGHIATAICSGEVFLNGVFNGVGAESHRAIIPGVTMFRVEFNADVEKDTRRYYKFNVQEGFYHEDIDSPIAYVNQYIYAHNVYRRVLVSHINARRKTVIGGIVPLVYINDDIMNTPDINFEPPKPHLNANWMTTGRTKSSESSDVSTQLVYVYYHYQPLTLNVAAREEDEATVIMSLDTDSAAAAREFDLVAEMIALQGHDHVFDLHKNAWKATWNRGQVEVTGEELRLNKIVWFSQYQLLSASLPYDSGLPFQTLSYGVSRSSLGHGKDSRDYNGHMFWDTELYLMPALFLFHPDRVKVMMRYRTFYREQAVAHAKAMGAEGYRFPWESAYSGQDVTPDTCIECREKQLHVTGAVAWAARQYFSATRDMDYLTNPETMGCDMSREIANFFQSIAEYNEETASYDIKDVSGPDDWHPNVNNNAYTNVQACLAIHWARYIACQCNRNPSTEVPDAWLQKAMYMSLPYDNERRLHYQHDGYENNVNNNTIKQADTILMTFPIYWNTTRDIMRNDLYEYETKTQIDTPAMTHSFMAGGFQFLGEHIKMLAHFDKSYQDYVAEPFKLWKEYANERGSINFLPGAGGFLQSLIYGFGGVRIRPEYLEFHNPVPPPRCDVMRFIGFNYLGAVLTIEIRQSVVTIDLITPAPEHQLIVRKNGTIITDELLTQGGRVSVENPSLGFWIMSDRGFPCEHPRDHIYMPWGYHPWYSIAASTSPCLITLVCLMLATIFSQEWILHLR